MMPSVTQIREELARSRRDLRRASNALMETLAKHGRL